MWEKSGRLTSRRGLEQRRGALGGIGVRLQDVGSPCSLVRLPAKRPAKRCLGLRQRRSALGRAAPRPPSGSQKPSHGGPQRRSGAAPWCETCTGSGVSKKEAEILVETRRAAPPRYSPAPEPTRNPRFTRRCAPQTCYVGADRGRPVRPVMVARFRWEIPLIKH